MVHTLSALVCAEKRVVVYFALSDQLSCMVGESLTAAESLTA